MEGLRCPKKPVAKKAVAKKTTVRRTTSRAAAVKKSAKTVDQSQRPAVQLGVVIVVLFALLFFAVSIANYAI